MIFGFLCGLAGFGEDSGGDFHDFSFHFLSLSEDYFSTLLAVVEPDAGTFSADDFEGLVVELVGGAGDVDGGVLSVSMHCHQAPYDQGKSWDYQSGSFETALTGTVPSA